MLIDCDRCLMQGTDHCRDCFVTTLCEPSQGAVVLDADEERAVRRLADAGLIPEIRMRPKKASA